MLVVLKAESSTGFPAATEFDARLGAGEVITVSPSTDSNLDLSSSSSIFPGTRR
jgi:hypothetical protein